MVAPGNNHKLMIEEKIKSAVSKALSALSIDIADIELEFPADISHGDFSTNIALVSAKSVGKDPRTLAEEIKNEIEKEKPAEIGSVDIAGPGFINFTLSREYFSDSLREMHRLGMKFGHNDSLAHKRVIIEYTDPNPFKEFHVGHLMPNVIGESLSRLFEFTGAEVKRANYQGDVGMHVAKAVWGMTQDDGNFPAESDSLKSKIEFLGNAYAFGAQAFEESEDAKRAITRVNSEIYNRNNEEINNLYDVGRRWSLDNFERIYEILGTKFDFYFFESEVAGKGKEIVLEGLKKGIFEESDGAIIFPGEKYDLHTRVFINSKGLPTYEAKELALAKEKSDRYPYDISVVVTANEIDEYFKVLLTAMAQVFPALASKTKHLSHGMLRLPSGKISSRKGNVMSGESLVMEAISRSLEKMKEDYSEEERESIARDVGVSAVKYSILKQAIGKGVLFDLEKSLSFEGDSGPYLLYSTVRARSVLERAQVSGMAPSSDRPSQQAYLLERLLSRFPQVVKFATQEFAPHRITNYLVEIAGEFNSFYAQERIADPSDDLSPYKLSLTKGFVTVMENGLYALGIRIPDKM